MYGVGGRGDGGGGGGAFPYRSPHQQGGGRGSGRGSRRCVDKGGKKWVAEVEILEEQRGIIIGRAGATIKKLQQCSGAHIRVPGRGRTGPAQISGPTVTIVLQACRDLANLLGNSGGQPCRLVMAENDKEQQLEGLLRSTDEETHLMFHETGHLEHGGMRVYALTFDSITEEQALEIMDDWAFSKSVQLNEVVQLVVSSATESLTFIYGHATQNVEEFYELILAKRTKEEKEVGIV
ncbi:hypothetical protein CYMTET_15364 [Cymbomonas tetramitiformis]|uniref:K Homology domain-containing protein n=1 Tax=Cymbomonas tetramitiformis TaxID=36881 RepID=A0AAE0GEC9_9CHLO|nr:hypothetical protein CYMTET_15364 [Cymbomonas tetramitiformis]